VEGVVFAQLSSETEIRSTYPFLITARIVLDAVDAAAPATRALVDADAGRAEEAAFVAVAGDGYHVCVYYGLGFGLEEEPGTAENPKTGDGPDA
jgi:hypothetical protein